jgi:hypothetical protein
MKQEHDPATASNAKPYGPLTTQRAEQLVNRIVLDDNPDQAAALMELITAIATDDDHIRREDVAHFAMQHAFTLCSGFDDAAEDFYRRTCGALRVEDKPSAQSTALARREGAKGKR